MRDVLQREDIDIVESVHRGMTTPAFDRGRFVADPDGSGLSEHAVHHFHGLVIEAMARYADRLAALSASLSNSRSTLAASCGQKVQGEREA